MHHLDGALDIGAEKLSHVRVIGTIDFVDKAIPANAAAMQKNQSIRRTPNGAFLVSDDEIRATPPVCLNVANQVFNHRRGNGV